MTTRRLATSPKKDDLTAKQRRFVSEYLKDMNATQAAIRAGYSAKTAKSIGQENLTKPAIAAAVQNATARVAERNEITVDSHLERLAELAKAAQDAGQFSAAISAEVNRGKVAGLYIERTEDVTALSKDERRERLLKLMA